MGESRGVVLMASIYSVGGSEFERCAIHKSLFRRIVEKRAQLQREANAKGIKGTVTFMYASKVLGERLK